jgi:hypothetical protein
VKRPSETQRNALKSYVDEAAATGDAKFRAPPYRNAHTIASLERHGWIDGNGITEAGRKALGAPPPRE